MRSITFTIPGPPRGKGRPRFARRGQHVMTYTDDKTAAYENLVALAYKAAGGEKLNGAIAVLVQMRHPIPKSASKAKRAGMIVGEIKPTIKCDADNCLKAVLDGLNGIAYDDDKQVVTIIVTKRYDEYPRVDVEISEV